MCDVAAQIPVDMFFTYKIMRADKLAAGQGGVAADDSRIGQMTTDNTALAVLAAAAAANRCSLASGVTGTPAVRASSLRPPRAKPLSGYLLPFLTPTEAAAARDNASLPANCGKTGVWHASELGAQCARSGILCKT